MPLKRRLIKVGSSRAIAIPPDWIELHEKRLKHPIDELLMEVGDTIILNVDESVEPEQTADKDNNN